MIAWRSIFRDKSVLITGISFMAVPTGKRFFPQLPGAPAKRWPAPGQADFRRLLTQAGVVLAVAVLIFAVSNLYLSWPPFGLKVTYFRGTNFEEKICSRTERALCRDYGNKSPARGVPSKKFSALWEGILRVPQSGDYIFAGQSDDGLRLIIDGTRIIDNWCDQSWGARTTGGRVHLSAGDHAIAVEHYNNEGESALRIKWSGGPIPPNTILSAPYVIPRESRYLVAGALGWVLAGTILKVALLFAVLILPGYCILRRFAEKRVERDQAFILAAPATVVLLGLIFVVLFALSAPGWVHQIVYVLAIIGAGALAIGRKVRKDIAGLSGACQAGLLFAFLSALISVCYVATADHIHPAVAIQGFPEVARRNPPLPMGEDNGIQYYAGLTFARHLDADALTPSWGGDIWKISDRPPLLGTLYAIELLATGSSDNPLYWNYELLGIVLNSLYLIPLYLLLARLFRDRRMAGWIAAAVLLNTFVFINTWYTWPKLMAMYFVLTAVFYVLARDGFRRRDALVTGICCGLAALSHGGAVLSLPGLMLYQGVALWRRGKSLRRVFVIVGLIAIFIAAFLVVQLPWEIYKKRNSPDRSVILKFHYFSNYGAVENYKPDLVNKLLTASLSDWIVAFFQSTTPQEQYRHRLSNLAASLRANGFAELFRTILSGKWGSYFKSVHESQFFNPLPAVGPLTIIFGVFFLVASFIRRRVATPGGRNALNADMPKLLVLFSFAIVSLIFNTLLKWSGPKNFELPYLELVLNIALLAGFAFSLHLIMRIMLMTFIGLQFFGYVYFATLALGYSVLDFFRIAMTAAVIAVLLIPVVLPGKRAPQDAASSCRDGRPG